jgi:hypothetical protein
MTSSSGNIFQQVLNDANGVQNQLLGPTYPYYQNVNTPSQIGMSSNGNLQTLGNDIEGLISYVELLVSGTGSASSTGQPLGNKFFLKTGAKCMDTATNQQVDRYIYVDNVPTGDLPFISSAMGEDFTEFKGLIPGAMSDLNVLNPYTIMQSFLSGATPPCQEVTLQTIDNNNNSSNETQYVTLVDLQNMDPCSLPNGVNNYTSPPQTCQQAFTNRTQTSKPVMMPKDLTAQIYFASLAAVGVYVVYRLMEKSR